MTLLMFAAVLFLGNGINVCFGCPVELTLVQWLETALIGALYFLSRFRKRTKNIKMIFCLSMILLSPFFYFYAGGLLGSFFYLYIPVFLFTLLGCNGREQKVLFSTACFILVVSVFVEYRYPETVFRPQNKKLQYLNILLDVFFDVLLIAHTAYFLKKKYVLEKTGCWYRIEGQPGDNLLPECKQQPHIHLLSRREREVYQLIIKGNTNKEIAEALFVSTGTVKNHITHIYKKLNVNNRLEFFNKFGS
jgi:DNA-binding CsgD family transcriptional regulator